MDFDTNFACVSSPDSLILQSEDHLCESHCHSSSSSLFPPRPSSSSLPPRPPFFPPLFQSIVLILQNSGFKVQTLWFPLRELIDITSIVLTISGSIYRYFGKRASLVAQW